MPRMTLGERELKYRQLLSLSEEPYDVYPCRVENRKKVKEPEWTHTLYHWCLCFGDIEDPNIDLAALIQVGDKGIFNEEPPSYILYRNEYWLIYNLVNVISNGRFEVYTRLEPCHE